MMSIVEIEVSSGLMVLVMWLYIFIGRVLVLVEVMKMDMVSLLKLLMKVMI